MNCAVHPSTPSTHVFMGRPLCERCRSNPRKAAGLIAEARNAPLVVSSRIYNALPPQSRRGLWPEGR